MSPWADWTSSVDHAELNLWLTCLAMGVGAYIPGALALLMPSRQARSHLASTISAGLLLGAGLCVIVPEGFSSLAEAQESLPPENHWPDWMTGGALLLGFLAMAALDSFLDHRASGQASAHEHAAHLTAPAANASAARAGPLPAPPHHPHNPSPRSSMQGLRAAAYMPPPCCSRALLEESDPTCGLTCTTETSTATVLNGQHHMDDTATHAQGHLHGAGHVHIHALGAPAKPCCTPSAAAAKVVAGRVRGWAQQPLLATGNTEGDEEQGPTLMQLHDKEVQEINAAQGLSHAADIHPHSHGVAHRAPSSPQQALIGLVLHSAADGMAVGAAALSRSLVTSLTVAVSIMIHKMPVAYGLSSFLCAAGCSHRHAHGGERGDMLHTDLHVHGLMNDLAGLIYFSLAAPLAALVTFYGLGHMSWITHPQAVSLVLLASGGTVLHAGAVHVLPGAGKSPLDLVVMSMASVVPLIMFALMEGAGDAH